MAHRRQTPEPACRGVRESGFTLVEVLCAVALMSVGLLAVLSANQASRDTQRRAHNILLGRNFAQSKIEDLRTASFDSLPAMAGTTTDASLPRGSTVAVSVSKYPDASEDNLYKVTVVVAWPEGRGTRTLRHETLIARK